MRRRWVAPICSTALLFPSHPYRRPLHQPLRSRSSPFAFARTAGYFDPQHPSSREGSTLMNVIIQKLNGLWHLTVGSCQIRTPFLETQDRALVVAYAHRVYPGAKVFERD